MARQTSQGGMIPEQVWDAEDIPKRFLFNGHPAGSGMPLVWAHSEYIKLLRSLHANAVWDMPPQTVERYLKHGKTADFQIWTTSQRRAWLTPGKNLRVDLDGPAQVEWTVDGSSHVASTSDTGFGLHAAMLPLSATGPDVEISVKLTPNGKDTDKLKPDSFVIRTRP
jgi:glucoamylase